MSSPIESRLGRSIWKKSEPITVTTVTEAGRTVLLDLLGEDDVALATGIPMVPSTSVPGVYRRTFVPSELDTLLDPNPTERFIVWRAHLSPADPLVPDRIGSFYRGGHVDLPAGVYAAPLTVAYAAVDVPERYVVAGQVDYVQIDLGYGKALRRLVSYRPGSKDVERMTDVFVDQ